MIIKFMNNFPRNLQATLSLQNVKFQGMSHKRVGNGELLYIKANWILLECIELDKKLQKL